MQDENALWQQIPYVNMGLMAGLDRSSGQKSMEGKSPMQLGTINHELMKLCPPMCRETVQGLFIYRHGDELRKFRGEWFLPHWLLGAGLVNLKKYTKEQRLKAAVTRMCLSLGVIKPLKDRSETDWALYDMFRKTCRRECPLLTEYSWARYDDDDRYHNAFMSVVLQTWADDGLGALLKLQLHKSASWPDQLERAVTFVNKCVQVETHCGTSLIFPLKQEEMEAVQKDKTFPVWGLGGGE